jgi:hypothetical protein
MTEPNGIFPKVAMLLDKNAFDAARLCQSQNLKVVCAHSPARFPPICQGHWNYFESATLTALLGRQGFEARFLETYISELDRVLAYPDTMISTAWKTLLGTSLEEPRRLDTERLHREMLGYKLFGLFRKIPVDAGTQADKHHAL